MIPVIFGLAGTSLSDSERALFRAADPAGYILFGRNIADPAQVRALTDDLRDLSGRDNLPILIDQEGGRVARLKSPHWPDFPAAARFDVLYDVAPASAMAAVRSNGVALGLSLAALGISVDCLPLLDLRHPGAHDIVGDRSLGGEPVRVAALGRAILDGLTEAGVAGVLKHMPGHGRAMADSHHSLPIVHAEDAALTADIAPFATLAAQARMAMTAHVIYTAWDAEAPATWSAKVIGDIIRRRIGFDGLLMSDDIEMQALNGPVDQRAVRALSAGCDVVLHCSGDFAAMQGVADAVGSIAAMAKERLERATHTLGLPDPQRLAAAIAHRDALLALAA